MSKAHTAGSGMIGAPEHSDDESGGAFMREPQRPRHRWIEGYPGQTAAAIHFYLPQRPDSHEQNATGRRGRLISADHFYGSAKSAGGLRVRGDREHQTTYRKHRKRGNDERRESFLFRHCTPPEEFWLHL